MRNDGQEVGANAGFSGRDIGDREEHMKTWIQKDKNREEYKKKEEEKAQIMDPSRTAVLTKASAQTEKRATQTAKLKMLKFEFKRAQAFTSNKDT